MAFSLAATSYLSYAKLSEMMSESAPGVEINAVVEDSEM
jgi:hypothetical protein